LYPAFSVGVFYPALTSQDIGIRAGFFGLKRGIMQPVWVLSVDLQTKTATFQSGLSDAAKSARGAFTQIQSGSGEMGRAVSGT